jgi:hypothetical protein
MQGIQFPVQRFGALTQSCGAELFQIGFTILWTEDLLTRTRDGLTAGTQPSGGS